MRFPLLFTLAALAALVLLCLAAPFPLQVFWLFLAASAFFMGLAATVSTSAITYPCIAVFTLLIPLTVAEGYYYHHIKQEVGIDVQRGGIFAKGLAQPDANIGYAPVPGSVVSSRSVRDGVQLYDVTYTINAQGRRVTPDAPDADTAVLLFGCSFTLGEGLQDQQTLAWKLGEALGPRYQVFNFGLSGYGPHHMQALIERGLPELARYKHIEAYHLAIRGHQRRVAGISPWDRQGPRYVLQDGKAVRQGVFTDDGTFFWEGPLGPWLERSYFFQGIKQPLAERLVPLNTLEKRLELTRAIIASSARQLRAAWPQANFTVLAWPPDTSDLLKNLPESGVPVLDVQQWLPHVAEHPQQYKIPGDNHPNALANQLAAQGLAQKLRTRTP